MAENIIDDDLGFVGFNETGNLVYVSKPVGGPETFFVIDLDKRETYDKCFNDAAERMKSPDMQKQQSEIKNKFAGKKMLNADDAIKPL